MRKHPQLVERTPGYFEYQLPVSVKGVIIWNGCVPLLKNERNEWELPGGKLEIGDEVRSTLAREISEELGWDSVEVKSILHSWVYEIRPDRHVFVVAYLARYEGPNAPTYSHEHKELGVFPVDEIEDLNMPEDYKSAIKLAIETAR